MKKGFAWMLALALMLGTGTTAMAANNKATITEDKGTATAPVTGTYVLSGDQTVYNVDITWEDLSFTYNEEAKGIWNPTTHTYDGEKKEAGWENKTAVITIKNHSNTDVAATPSYKAEEGFADVNMQFSNSNNEVLADKAGENVITYISIGSADNGKGDNGAGSPVTETLTVKPTGELPPGTNNEKIGTITITIQDLTKISVKPDTGWDGDHTVDF